MTTLDPTFAAFDRPDQLGGALQQGLPRPMNPKLSWSVIRTFFLGGISGGIVPTVVLPKRFRNFATAEQLQFWHLAEWLRLQTGDAEAASATDAAKRVTPGSVLRLASIAFVIVAIGIAMTALPHHGPVVSRWFALTLPQFKAPPPVTSVMENGPPRIIHDYFSDRSDRYGGRYVNRSSHDEPDGATYRGGAYRDDGSIEPSRYGGRVDEAIATARPPLISSDLTNAFALAMAGAALCWLIEINAHIGRVRRFIGTFNQLSGRYGVGPVRPPGLHLGIRPLWLLGAAATCALGGFWALPVMLAAGAQRRYIRSTSPRLRSDLARRQREVLLARRPAIRVPTSTYLMDICPRENCRAPLPPEAVFCRRCGTKLKA